MFSLSTLPSSKRFPSRLVLLIFSLSIIILIQTLHPSYLQLLQLPFKETSRTDVSVRAKVKCVRPLQMKNATEGLGAILRRNQLALFLADVYGARMSWDYMRSSHRYDTNQFFSDCPSVPDGCSLNQKSMVLPRCRRGDCQCLWNGVSKYTARYDHKCEILGLKNDRLVTQEYSGCTSDVMRRYFVPSNRTVSQEIGGYDAIHVRMGDLKNKNDKKSPSETELYYLLEAMCKVSDRRIYILSEGNPDIPDVSCFDRVFMASDTSLPDAFSIMRYAKTVSIGSSSFSIIMAEVAEPEQVVTLYRALSLYEWMRSEMWTVVMDKGEFFHFDSKDTMVETLLTGKDPRARTYRREGWFNSTDFKMKKIPATRHYNQTEFWTPK